MLSYELCKKLKEAGFNLCTKHRWYYGFDKELKNSRESFIDSKFSAIIIPTLEELIEACGIGFKILVRGLMCPRGTIWRADSVNDKTGFGDTPSEAVANLYLVINQK